MIYPVNPGQKPYRTTNKKSNDTNKIKKIHESNRTRKVGEYELSTKNISPRKDSISKNSDKDEFKKIMEKKMEEGDER